ncbi:hypothetical protein [Mycobacterium canetti]|uniref:hypothetical protein n=1 Tax=Mycobacterium canetti TaxID=78331 RepID=UPI002D79F824|nr:hypothetical protein [Mycobacterium canetti]
MTAVFRTALYRSGDALGGGASAAGHDGPAFGVGVDDGSTPAPSGHRGCRITLVEQLALAAAVDLLDDRDLSRVCAAKEPSGCAVPGFRSPRHVVEVKELTNLQVRRFVAACDEHLAERCLRVPGLQNLWAVSADVSVAAGAYDGRHLRRQLPSPGS